MARRHRTLNRFGEKMVENYNNTTNKEPGGLCYETCYNRVKLADGNMTATGNVEIAATGRVSGNIKTDSLVVAKGGCFTGNVTKINTSNVTKINEEIAATYAPLYLIEHKQLAGQIGPR
jgi:Polymer-forming cytoskeletal